MKAHKVRILLAVSGVLGFGGCATPGVPSELVDARMLRKQAVTGPAALYERPLVESADQSMQVAEEASRANPASTEAGDTSYIAKRRMEIAIARGNVHQAMAERRQYEVALRATRLARLQRVEKAARMRMQLAAVGELRDDFRGLVLSLQGAVLFPYGKSTLLADAERQLNQVAAALKEAKDQRIVIEGHTDSRGSRRYNERLSAQRAAAVREYLTGQGVNPEQLTSIGRGEELPVADNKSVIGRANNRRVELVIAPSKMSPTETGTGGSGLDEPKR